MAASSLCECSPLDALKKCAPPAQTLERRLAVAAGGRVEDAMVGAPGDKHFVKIVCGVDMRVTIRLKVEQLVRVVFKSSVAAPF